MDEIEKFKKRLAREKKARQQAEDLLEQKAADLYEKNRELLSLSDGLEKLVAQRTAQMQNARDDALKALQVKSDFIANMSHELRTPMNGVLGILGLLLEEDMSDSQRELLGIAQASGEHLLMVINDVLDFSKIEADKIDLVMAPVTLAKYIASMVKPFELQAVQKGIEFEYHIDEDVPSVLITDKLRLTQIITNLLSNAVKFTQKGSVSLHISHSNAVHDGYYRFSVVDTGIGISKGKLNTVFSAFEQADTSITREFGGTGLGMSITKRLVDMFEGQIHLESEFGKGTSFHVDLYCEKGQEAVSPVMLDTTHDSASSSVGEGTQDTLQANSGNVLLVEDNHINQLVAKRMLENWGLKVTIAENGQEAIELVSAQDFDLIFMDLQMPVLGGIDATVQMRQRHLVEPSLPIIAMTAHSGQEHIDECMQAGMQGHISKPIDKFALKAMIDQHLSPLATTNDAPQTNNGPNEHLEGCETDQAHAFGCDLSDSDLKAAAQSGINIKDGLARLNGDWVLLHTLIATFVKEHEDLGDTIRHMRRQDDRDDAQALLHRIKGSGSNLGLFHLAKLAGRAETAIRDGEVLNANEIKAIEGAFMAVQTGFAKIQAPTNEDKSITLRDESEDYILRTIELALVNLSKDMMAVEEALKDLTSCTLDAQTASHINSANDAMQRFDMLEVEAQVELAKKCFTKG